MIDEEYWAEVVEEITQLAEELGWQWVLVKNQEGEICGMKIGTEKYLDLRNQEVKRIH